MRRASRSADSAVALDAGRRRLRKADRLSDAARHAGLARAWRSSADGAPPVHIPVHGTDQVADVTGAGDTVLATFSLALASGRHAARSGAAGELRRRRRRHEDGNGRRVTRRRAATRSRRTGPSSRERET